MPTTIQLFVFSAAASVLARAYTPAYSLGLISNTVLLFLALFLAKITWSVVIYPKVFSPLRHLPTPDDNSFFSGQTKRVFREASGRPMRHWIENVPNEGLIKYAVWFRERVLVTDTKTLGEVLVTKVSISQLMLSDLERISLLRILTASRTTSSSSRATSAKASRGYWESASCSPKATSTRGRERLSCQLSLSATSRNCTRSSGPSPAKWSSV